MADDPLTRRPDGAGPHYDIVIRAVDALEDTLATTIALCETLTAVQWQTPTGCPGWTVHDQVSHLAGLEAALVGRERPAHDVPDLPHVSSDFDREIERDVDYRRNQESTTVLAELREVVRQRVAQLRANMPEPTDRIPHVDGRPIPAWIALSMRVTDAWVHGNDIRRALEMPLDDHSPAAELACDFMLRSLDGIVVALEPDAGTIVRVEITGTFEFVRVVAVDAVPTESPTTTLRMDVNTFGALAAGRVPRSQLDIDITGDTALAESVIGRLNVTP